MNLLLDTNIILYVTKTNDFSKTLPFINPERSILYVSIVSEAEIRSLALRNKWGAKRLDYLNDFLDKCSIVAVNELLVSSYVEIDSYSQRLNPNFTSYPFDTPRNMGKNDLWIASLAAFLGLRLVTTDSDFDHLHNIFFEVKKIQPTDFVPYF
jgi:tRNA(fMet)-specific endonuclease VapC